MKYILVFTLILILTSCSKKPKSVEMVKLNPAQVEELKKIVEDGKILQDKIVQIRTKRSKLRPIFLKHKDFFNFKEDSFYSKLKKDVTIWSDGSCWIILFDGNNKKLFEIQIALNGSKEYTKKFAGYDADFLSRMGWVQVKAGEFAVRITSAVYNKELSEEFEKILNSFNLINFKALFSENSPFPELKKGYLDVIELQKEIDKLILEEKDFGQKAVEKFKILLPPKEQTVKGYKWLVFYSNYTFTAKLKDETEKDRVIVNFYYNRENNLRQEKNSVYLIAGKWLIKASSKGDDETFGGETELNKIISLFPLIELEKI